jgi:hypothetical protein
MDHGADIEGYQACLKGNNEKDRQHQLEHKIAGRHAVVPLLFR